MVQISGSNHYARLGVSRDASPEEIRSAYFLAARRYHPDNNPGADASDLFLLIQEAYEILSNPEKRVEYDAQLKIPDHQAPAAQLQALYSRSSVPVLREGQMLYVQLDIQALPEKDEQTRAPLNLCLVLDRSTSMQGQRMDMVKSNAIQLLRHMKASDIISIVAFSDRAEVIIPATRMADLGRIESRISQLSTGGGTEIFHGLEMGINQIRRNLSSATVNHLILLTDGRTYGDEAACVRLAEEAGSSGIGISGLGIGHEWNDTFLDQLATLSGGTSLYISSPKELQNFLDQKYNSLGRIFAEQVLLEFTPSSEVELRYAFRIHPEAGPLSIESPILVGNLLQNQPLSILFEFLVNPVPENKPDVDLLSGNLRMEVPTRAIPSQRIPFGFSRPVTMDSSPESAPNPIVQALSKLTLYRIQERARQEVSAGEIRKATKHLQYLATHLLSQGEKELAQTVLIEAENIQKSKQFSKEGDKRIKYGTRALLLPPGMENNLI